MPELFLLLAVGYFFIILLTLFKRGSRGRIARSLIFYVLFALIGVVFQYLFKKGVIAARDTPTVKWFPHLFILFLSIWFVSLSRDFLALRIKSNLWVIFGFCWLVAVIFTIALLTSRPEILTSGLQQQTLFMILIVLGYILMMGGVAILTVSAYRLAKTPLHRNRILYWVLGLTCTVCGDILVFTGAGIAGSTLRLIGTFFVAYVLLIYDLADALQAGIRALFYLIVSIISLFVYTLVFILARAILQNRTDNPVVFWVALAVLLVVIINPLLRRITDGLRRLVMGAGYNTSNAVREYSLRISNIVDLEVLATAILDTLHKNLDIHKGHLFLVDEVNEEGRIFYNLRVVKTADETEAQKEENRIEEKKSLEKRESTSEAQGDTHEVMELTMPEKTLDGRLGSESPIALYFTQTHHALRQYDLDYALVFKQVPPEEREWLTALDADVCVPIYDKMGWTALLVLGPKASGQPYTKEDVTLLSTLADQTAVALENARHFTDLLKLNEDLQKTYTALEKANQQLREVDELKSAFIGVITHEMRTPFANLQFNLQILEMYGKDHLLPEQKDQLVQLSKGVNTARKMVDNLITLASFFSRQIVLIPEEIDFKELMRITFPPLKEMADEKNITFQVDIVGKLTPVQGDRNLLADALYQMVHNAIKFTRDGGKVWVSCWTTVDSFFFDVRDTGGGIPQEKLTDIWKSFTQTADPLRRGLEGLGLGLALVKNIVTAHAGEVWVESHVGSGSVFGFKIPLKKGDNSKVEVEQVVKEETEGSPQPS
jgi:signal transduction histidine kinase